MRNFNAKDYIKLIEHSTIKELNAYMDAEKEIIKLIPQKENKTIIDLGAGHGRLLPFLTKYFSSVYSIEINPEMLKELRYRSRDNSFVIEGDITKFPNLIKNYDIKNPVISLFQNTLGTIEGDWEEVIQQINLYKKNRNTSIFISFFRASAMNNWGKNVLFKHLKPMIGEIDYKKSKLDEGQLVTKNNYTSKWWTDDEINNIIKSFDKEVLINKKNEIYNIYYLK